MARVRFVVHNVVKSASLSSEAETVYRVLVREASHPSAPTFVLHVAQRPEAPAPYDVGHHLNLDPRLLDRA
jgi:hypothetical protein